MFALASGTVVTLVAGARRTAGSVVFRSFGDRIGALPDPTISIGYIVVVAVGLLALANLGALIPARRAQRLPAATLLRDE